MGPPNADTILISVPEWDRPGRPGEVLIRRIEDWEREHIGEMLAAGEIENFRARCSVHFLSDAGGKRLMKPLADVTVLGTKSGVAMNRIVEAGAKFNNFPAPATPHTHD